MRTTPLAFFVILLTAGLATAQDDAAALATSAGRALISYNTDPSNNIAKLSEAKQQIDQAIQMPDAQTSYIVWYNRGTIYSTLIEKDLSRRVIDPNAPLSGDNDALVASDSYAKAYELATDTLQKSDAVKGIIGVQGSLINLGLAKYSAGQYDKAYFSLRAALQSHELLKASDQKGFLGDKAGYNNALHLAALAASQAKRCADAIPMFQQLVNEGSTNEATYEGLYTCKMESGDEAGAQAILAEGRKRFPEAPGLLFAEINAYLKAGKLDTLTDRLKAAIAKEPNNVGLYVTLGNVYDNLYQRELQAKNEARTTEYFGEAKKYYLQATEKDPKNVGVVYSLGALYYNKAAVRTQELNALPEDHSAAGIKTSDAVKKDINTLFDLALPYFQTAESLDPNDMNTLIALNELYARKQDETLSSEFKKRLDTVKGGGKNPRSYFKQ